MRERGKERDGGRENVRERVRAEGGTEGRRERVCRGRRGGGRRGATPMRKDRHRWTDSKRETDSETVTDKQVLRCVHNQTQFHSSLLMDHGAVTLLKQRSVSW